MYFIAKLPYEGIPKQFIVVGDVVLGSQNDVNKAAKEPQTFFRFKERYGMGLQLLRQVEMCKIIETKTKIVLRKQCIVLGIFEGF